MENNPYPSNIDGKIAKVLKKTNKNMNQKEITCFCNLYSFLKYKSDVAFQRFKRNFKQLSNEEKKNVVSLYLRLQSKEKINAKIKTK